MNFQIVAEMRYGRRVPALLNQHFLSPGSAKVVDGYRPAAFYAWISTSPALNVPEKPEFIDFQIAQITSPARLFQASINNILEFLDIVEVGVWRLLGHDKTN